MASPSSDLPAILRYRLYQPFTPHFPAIPEISMPINHRSEGLLMASECRQSRKGRTERSRGMSFIARHPATMTTDWCWCDVGQVKRIDVLPDEVLLEIFDFYMIMNLNDLYGEETSVKAWQTLVHVCQRWRSLVFESRRRLKLRLTVKSTVHEFHVLLQYYLSLSSALHLTRDPHTDGSSLRPIR